MLVQFGEMEPREGMGIVRYQGGEDTPLWRELCRVGEYFCNTHFAIFPIFDSLLETRFESFLSPWRNPLSSP